MKVVKLSKEHIEDIKSLFMIPKFMSVDTTNNYFVDKNVEFSDFYHKTFAETYMSNLTQYHAYGIQNNDNKFSALLGFYESVDDASWYWNTVRTLGNNKNEIKILLDTVLNHNEKNGRFKFYSMFPLKYRNIYRRLAFSDSAKERYDYFDEYCVDSRHQCKFNLAWQILFTRTLLPVDTIVRCTFLKQKYREQLYNGGNL